MKKGIWGRLAALFMALALVMTFAATPAYAAAKKSVKKCSFTTKISTINKKGTTVKKGTTKLTIKKGQGYIKFKAPKTATYTITFSDLRNKSSIFTSNAYVSIYKKSKYSSLYVSSVDVKTKGGKGSTLWLSVDGCTHTGTLKYRPIAKRSGKLKLKKGEWVYMYFNDLAGKTTCTLKIK